MAAVNSIRSSRANLRIAREAAGTVGVLPGSPTWRAYEPNAYPGGFGGTVGLTKRDPIVGDRQNRKSLMTDKDSSFEFEQDLMQFGFDDLWEGLFFAAYRYKSRFGGEGDGDFFTGSGTNTYTGASSFAAGSKPARVGALFFAKNFALSSGNGLKRVTNVSTVTLTVAETVGSGAHAGATDAELIEVGFQFGTGEVDIVVSGDFATISRASGTKDFTEFGLIPGEPIWVGGDSGTLSFTNAENNGKKRVRSVSATAIVVDKSALPMVAETGTGKTIQIFFGGKILKNESDPTLISEITYQAERTLGAPDSASPTQIQSEYVVGTMFDKMDINIPTADKVVAACNFVGISSERRTGVTGVKGGTRPSLADSFAFNTSTHAKHFYMYVVSTTNEAPSRLFPYCSNFTLSVMNGVTANKAVTTLGGFELNYGNFSVEIQVDAYFSDVASIDAVNNNSDVSCDFHFVQRNKALMFDVPLITLGDGRAQVEKDQPIKLPLNAEASRGADVVSTMDHTLLLSIFDYIPTAAA